MARKRTNLMTFSLVTAATLLLAGCSSSRHSTMDPADFEDVEITSLAILPVPSQAVPAATQEALLSELSEAIKERYKIPAVASLTLGRAVFGDLGTGEREAEETFRQTLAEAKESFDRLIFRKALKLFEQARDLLPLCGARIRDPALLQEVYVYLGLVLFNLERVEEAEAAFRQLVSLNEGFEPPEPLFRPEHIECFERAKRTLLSGNPFQVQVLSWPEGATLFLDGQKKGQTPVGAIKLRLGRHFLRAELDGYGPYVLNMPDAAPPESIKAWLFPVWPGEDPPEELMEEFMEGEGFSDTSIGQLKTISSTYDVDAVMVLQFGLKGKEVQVAARLFVEKALGIAREGIFNLGAGKKTQAVRIKQMVRVFKELKKPKKKKPKKKDKPKAKPGPKPKPEPKPEPKIEPEPEPKPKPKPKGKKKKKRKKKTKAKKPMLEEPPDV
jgi:tetratricopeptide (TPR) repeat protein